MNKPQCPICEKKFRHLYLYIRHIRVNSDIENKLIQAQAIKDNPHSRVYKRFLDKCTDKVKEYMQ